MQRLTTISLVAFLVAAGCSKEEGPTVAKGAKAIEVGGLYATRDDDGSWRVMKVLVLDDHAVHLRAYANKFPQQPTDVDPAVLTLGGVKDGGGLGIGHFPVAREGFWKDNPVLIKVVPVKEDELEGYKIYLEAMRERR